MSVAPRILQLMTMVLAAWSIAVPASAAIDMSGIYEAIEFPCRYTVVHTGTALQVSGPCGPAGDPLSLTGTIDPDTGQFTLAGSSQPICASLGLTGTADGEMFTATYTCDGNSGPVTATKCLNGLLDPGEDCQDGNVDDGDCCSARCRFEPAGSACAIDQNACTDDACDGAGVCAHVPNTAPCQDGNSCTYGDACAGGTCVSGAMQPAPVCRAITACDRTVARVVASCVGTVGTMTRRCYLRTGAPCPPADAGIAKALDKLAERITARCPDPATVQAVGYGTGATPATLIARAQELCTGEVAAIAARTFGGPHAALLAGADTQTARCLSRASAMALKIVDREIRVRASCVAKTQGAATPCDVGDTNARIARVETVARDAIEASCPGLEATIGVDPPTYVSRAAAQARCATAAAHGDATLLSPDCGPRGAVPVPQRGVWTRVVLEEATHGSRCGDGSPYAFWLRLAPAGSTSRKVVVNLQGGGACYFAADCATRPAGLFNAMETFWDAPPTTGILSTSAAENPFSDWTMVFLPYCTQDAHIGGGVTQVFPDLTVHRFGAINVRAALRYVRDVLWKELAAAEPEGYRPDRLTVLFAGMSAGGDGVRYNYHYLLDDLRWAHTTAIPDSGIGVLSSAFTTLAPLVQAAWGTKPNQPPYCLAPSCAIGPVGLAATAPRLKAVPEQQILHLSNQVDEVVATAGFFANLVDWINAVRSHYCATRGLNGVHYWLPAESTPLHVFLDQVEFSPMVTVGGENLASFLAGAVSAPDAVTDHVDEGTLVADYPGVNPIACPLN